MPCSRCTNSTSPPCSATCGSASAARAGAGIGLLHAFMAEGVEGLVPVLPGAVDFRLPFTLSTRPDSPAVDAVAIVREALRDEVDRRRAELMPGG